MKAHRGLRSVLGEIATTKPKRTLAGRNKMISVKAVARMGKKLGAGVDKRAMEAWRPKGRGR